jgi:prolyl oligopeptidase
MVDRKHGESNGGLLAGAVLTQRPDLFKAVIIDAPLLDMLRYHKYGGGQRWMNDYGNPDESSSFKHIYAYSPYHNVKDKTDYPATLIIIGRDDYRVHPMHSYKMAARLQSATVSNNPILLRAEKNAGHGGSVSSKTAKANQYVDFWSFIFWQLGMSEIIEE